MAKIKKTFTRVELTALAISGRSGQMPNKEGNRVDILIDLGIEDNFICIGSYSLNLRYLANSSAWKEVSGQIWAAWNKNLKRETVIELDTAG